MKTEQNNWIILSLAVAQFALLTGISQFRHGEWFYPPYVAAWVLASVNFVFAVKAAFWARREPMIKAMAIVFGGMGARMTVILAAAASVFMFKKSWAFPFTLPLLGCFLVYFVAELVLIITPARATEVRP